MYEIIDGIRVYYDLEGSKDVVVLLHGWGCSRSIFNRLKLGLIDNFSVLSIDLPGFGESEIIKGMSIYDMAIVVNKIVLKHSFDNISIIAHSYGGRVGIMYASMFKVNKLVLIGVPAFKNKLSFKKRVKVLIYKLFKKFNLKLKMGSRDYQNSNPLLKETLVKAVNYDLTNEISRICAKCLVIAGVYDKEVKLVELERLNELLNDSMIIKVLGGHFMFLERPLYFNIVINSFLIGDDSA